MAVTMVSAKSMRQALLLGTNTVHQLHLVQSKDMVCRNFMCEKLGQACACKFARYMEQNEWASLEDVSISGNKLTSLPLAMFTPRLRLLDASSNALTTLDVDYFARSPRLEVVNLAGNDKLLRQRDWDHLLRAVLPGIKQILW